MSAPSYLFLIGAPKCGTSTLTHWLGNQPGIVLSRAKEPCYFTDFGTRDWTGWGVRGFTQPWLTDWDAYDGLFETEGDPEWRVDGSTDYLSNDTAFERLQVFAKTHSVKLALILRDPIERAISEHQHLLRDEYAREPLMAAIEAEEARIRDGMHPLFYHVARSHYHAAVTRYRETFGEDLLILDYHLLRRDPQEVLNRLAGFIGRDPVEETELKAKNVGTVYKAPMLRKVIKNKGLIHFARRVVPKSIRSGIRSRVEDMSTYRYQATEAEIEALRVRLAEDIAACQADPHIPTGNWTYAIGKPGKLGEAKP